MRSWLLLLTLAACSGNDVGPRELHYDLGTCGTVDILDEDPGIHVPTGSDIQWSTNPPASGAHYPIWAAYDRSYVSLERGFWVHNAEHGALVLAYRCDVACPDVIAGLEGVVRALPVDSKCQGGVKTRALVVADPLLPADMQVFAIAWGSLYTATCVDPDAIQAFSHDFYGSGPEDTCAEGASLGGTPIL